MFLHNILQTMAVACMLAAVQTAVAHNGYALGDEGRLASVPGDVTFTRNEGVFAHNGGVFAHNGGAFAPDSTLKAGAMVTHADSVKLNIAADSVPKRKKRDWVTWRPNAKRAMWLAIVLPGAGQIYNRKYWKLPIVYGGFVGCAYAMRWNNQMYRDYSQAYMDIMDDDPNTQSYNQFLHLGAKIDDSNLARYQTLFKKRKDKFRRWRDMSFFCLVAVYALSVVDAYVDASLSEFDISKDLSLRVEPAIINNNVDRNPLKSNALGLSCSLNF